MKSNKSLKKVIFKLPRQRKMNLNKKIKKELRELSYSKWIWTENANTMKKGYNYSMVVPNSGIDLTDKELYLHAPDIFKKQLMLILKDCRYSYLKKEPNSGHQHQQNCSNLADNSITCENINFNKDCCLSLETTTKQKHQKTKNKIQSISIETSVERDLVKSKKFTYSEIFEGHSPRNSFLGNHSSLSGNTTMHTFSPSFIQEELSENEKNSTNNEIHSVAANNVFFDGTNKLLTPPPSPSMESIANRSFAENKTNKPLNAKLCPTLFEICCENILKTKELRLSYFEKISFNRAKSEDRNENLPNVSTLFNLCLSFIKTKKNLPYPKIASCSFANNEKNNKTHEDENNFFSFNKKPNGINLSECNSLKEQRWKYSSPLSMCSNFENICSSIDSDSTIIYSETETDSESTGITSSVQIVSNNNHTTNIFNNSMLEKQSYFPTKKKMKRDRQLCEKHGQKLRKKSSQRARSPSLYSFTDDDDNLPELARPKKRFKKKTIKKNQDMCLPTNVAMERLSQEFPQHNWLQNKYSSTSTCKDSSLLENSQTENFPKATDHKVTQSSTCSKMSMDITTEQHPHEPLDLCTQSVGQTDKKLKPFDVFNEKLKEENKSRNGKIKIKENDNLPIFSEVRCSQESTLCENAQSKQLQQIELKQTGSCQSQIVSSQHERVPSNSLNNISHSIIIENTKETNPSIEKEEEIIKKLLQKKNALLQEIRMKNIIIDQNLRNTRRKEEDNCQHIVLDGNVNRKHKVNEDMFDPPQAHSAPKKVCTFNLVNKSEQSEKDVCKNTISWYSHKRHKPIYTPSVDCRLKNNQITSPPLAHSNNPPFASPGRLICVSKQVNNQSLNRIGDASHTQNQTLALPPLAKPQEVEQEEACISSENINSIAPSVMKCERVSHITSIEKTQPLEKNNKIQDKELIIQKTLAKAREKTQESTKQQHTCRQDGLLNNISYQEKVSVIKSCTKSKTARTEQHNQGFNNSHLQAVRDKILSKPRAVNNVPERQNICREYVDSCLVSEGPYFNFQPLPSNSIQHTHEANSHCWRNVSKDHTVCIQHLLDPKTFRSHTTEQYYPRQQLTQIPGNSMEHASNLIILKKVKESLGKSMIFVPICPKRIQNSQVISNSVVTPSHQVTSKCHVCSKPANLLCSSCKGSWYCSKNCQLQHWSTHQSDCHKTAYAKCSNIWKSSE